jgi:uncharacterized protein (TIGR03437 family)
MTGNIARTAGIRILAIAALIIVPVRCEAQAYTITTVAGNGTNGFSGDAGAATGAQLSSPVAIAIDKAGTLDIADQGNNRIRQVSAGTISTVAGNGTNGYTGDGGKGSSAELSSPTGVAIDSSGIFYIADFSNSLVRKVTSSGTISTAAGNYTLGAGYSGDGAAAADAQLKQPAGVVLDAAGNLYISDFGNNVIRKVTSGGTITTFAGNGVAGYSGDGGLATSASLNGPRGIAVDASGNLYIADTVNHRIRKVAADGTIGTVAGIGTAGFSGDLNRATSAALNSPRGVAVDASGNLYIADSLNSRIRRVAANGAIATVAGSGRIGYSGDGGPATNASLFFPSGVAVDATGNVYIADTQSSAVRMIAPLPGTSDPPSVNQGGVIGSAAFGSFTSAAPGSWIEIYGTNLAGSSRGWSGSDFKGANAPTILNGTTVTIGGQPAFISYISAGQVNVQVPSNVGQGPQPVTVNTLSGSSDPRSLTVNAVQPGLFAPSIFQIGGKQYAGATFTDGGTFVLPQGAVPDVTSRPAKSGETIVLYGVGFGSVTPGIPPGQIAQQANSLTSQLQVYFQQTPATATYAGLAPNQVGLYQFNVVVPNVGSNAAVPLTFTLDGVSGAQTLYIAVQN